MDCSIDNDHGPVALTSAFKMIRAAGPDGCGARTPAGSYLGGSERAYPVPISTQRASWSLVRRSSELTRNHPGMSRSRMFTSVAFVVAIRTSDSRRVDADHGAALAAGGDGHVAADEEGEPAEHLLLGQLGITAGEPADTSQRNAKAAAPLACPANGAGFWRRCSGSYGHGRVQASALPLAGRLRSSEMAKPQPG